MHNNVSEHSTDSESNERGDDKFLNCWGGLEERERGRRKREDLRFLWWMGIRTTPMTEIKEIPTVESIPYNQASPVEMEPQSGSSSWDPPQPSKTWTTISGHTSKISTSDKRPSIEGGKKKK